MKPVKPTPKPGGGTPRGMKTSIWKELLLCVGLAVCLFVSVVSGLFALDSIL